jgi:hypothetical protein
VVEVSEIIVREADEPDVVADLFDADALTDEDQTEIDLLAIEADAAACGHGDGFTAASRSRIFSLDQKNSLLLENVNSDEDSVERVAYGPLGLRRPSP